MVRSTYEVSVENWLGRSLMTLSLDGPWTPEVEETFVASACVALEWRLSGRGDLARADVPSGDLNVTALAFFGRRRSDWWVTQHEMAEYLDIVAVADKPLDFSRHEALRTLAITDRPGLTGYLRTGLRDLTLSNAHAATLSTLNAASDLRGLKLQGRGQTFSIEPDVSLRVLEDLNIDEAHIRVAPGEGALKGLAALRQCRLMGDVDMPAEELDCGVFSRCESLERLTVRGFRRLRDVETLASLPRFKLLTVVGPADCRVSAPWVQRL